MYTYIKNRGMRGLPIKLKQQRYRDYRNDDDDRQRVSSYIFPAIIVLIKTNSDEINETMSNLITNYVFVKKI